MLERRNSPPSFSSWRPFFENSIVRSSRIWTAVSHQRCGRFDGPPIRRPRIEMLGAPGKKKSSWNFCEST